jgi:hypothetical protein
MYLSISVASYWLGIADFDTYVTSHDRGSINFHTAEL